ncbi:hypothetical protein BZA05DRAFT_385880 [Tricharina praecox]|uniref:uncharacterized protein n=1 Tax=Tricharina praecox TaxID=43433 RepID=UPI00221E73A4|nr:uncharacterized protein BZA05DRAFT_385880 [Tricharina praecox]KAI5858079.1 hypothetical protein BZA05DRAFT_385880 [Tricharina praecox]
MSRCRLPLRCCHPVAAARQSAPPPSLPFLYQTRSIYSPANSNNKSTRRGGGGWNGDGGRDSMVGEDIPFENASLNVEDSSDPFAYLYTPPPKPIDRRPPPPIFAAAPRTKRPHHDAEFPRSSITLREREIFTRIFESILNTPSASNRTSPLAKSFDATPRARGLPPPPALTDLFTSTIGPQSTGGNLSFAPQQLASQREGATAAMALVSTFASYPPSLRAAAARAAGLKDWATVQKLEAQIDVEALEAKKRSLRACFSDVKVLQWMETHVYPLPNDHSAPEASFYAELLAEAMDIFRRDYNDLGSVVAVFERAKSLGAESYVLGCTSAVYNRTLAAVWDGFGDIMRVRDLVEEMTVNAVGGDVHTAEILKKICDNVDSTFSGEKGELAAMMVGRQEMECVDYLRKRARRLEVNGTLDKPPEIQAREREEREAAALEKGAKTRTARMMSALKGRSAVKRLDVGPGRSAAGAGRGAGRDDRQQEGRRVEGRRGLTGRKPNFPGRASASDIRTRQDASKIWNRGKEE